MNYKKILLLNLIPDTIGDNILLTPLIKIIKKNIISSKIDISVSPSNSSLFLHNPNLNKIIIIDELNYISKRNFGIVKKSFNYVKMIIKYSKQFRTENYDICFVLLPNFPLNILIPYFSKIKNIIGYKYKHNIFSFLLTDKIKYNAFPDNQDPKIHIIDPFLALMKLKKYKWEKKHEVSELYINKNEISQAKKLLSNLKINKNFVCIQTGSKANSWSINNFEEVIKYLINNTKYDVLLHGSQNEFNKNQKLTKISNRVKNLCGVDLRIKSSIFSLAKYSICNDSGLAHMSSSIGTKTIVLYGAHPPTHCIPKGKGKVIPIYKGKNKFVIRESKEAKQIINLIKPKDVIKEIIRLR